MNNRRILTARLPGKPDSPAALLRLAIRQKTCVRATYNRTSIRLAPHALYTRHGDLFVDGVVLERDGAPPRELKLGTFKLDGLKDLAAAPLRFQPERVFDPRSPKYDEDALLIATA